MLADAGKGTLASMAGLIGEGESAGRSAINYVSPNAVNPKNTFPNIEESYNKMPEWYKGQGNYDSSVPAKLGANVVGAIVDPFTAVRAIKATKGLPVGMSIKDVSSIDKTVSTRLPTAVKATENPMTDNLLVDYDNFKKDPVAFKHNVEMMENYPNFPKVKGNAEDKANAMVEHIKDNLLFLHDAVPPETRERSKLWYDGANKIAKDFSSVYKSEPHTNAGVLAVLSPQKDWFMNVSLGDRVLDTMTNYGGYKWDNNMGKNANIIFGDPKYKPILKNIKGRELADLDDPIEKAMWLRVFDETYNPREHKIVTPEGNFLGDRLTSKGVPYKTGWGSLNEIGKAVNIYDNPTMENISNRLGTQHKVRNFYNNIIEPNHQDGHVTMDTHAIAAGLLRPLSGNSREVSHNFGSNMVGEVGPMNSSVTGMQGTYGLFADAYRKAAKERKILPREMQSITWEAVRGLFSDVLKRDEKKIKQIDGIWNDYKNGKININQARKSVVDSAGGIDVPEWEK
jgi:hypothetical protein